MKPILSESPNNYIFHRQDTKNESYYFVEPRHSTGYTDYILISNDGKDISESENITACKFRKVLWKKYANGEGQKDNSMYLMVNAVDRFMRYSNYYPISWSVREVVDTFKQFFIVKELPNLKSIYNYLKFEMRVPDALIKYYFRFDTTVIADDLENVTIGQTKILFPENIKEKNKEDIIDLVKTAKIYLENKNVGFLLYGIISIVKLSNRTLGDYDKVSNTIRIDYNAKKSNTALLTIFHELGHRLINKFLNYNIYEQIRNKYSEVMQEYVKIREQFRTNDLIYLIDKSVDAPDSIKNADYYVIEKVKRSSKDIKYYIVSIKDNNQGAYFVIGDNMIQRYFSKNPEKQVNNIENTKAQTTSYKDSWIPTPYAKTNSSEWFCELFASYIGNMLTGEPAKWIEDIILQAPTN